MRGSHARCYPRRMNGRLIAMVAAVGVLGACAPELVRPRPSGERLADRPKHALIVGQYRIVTEGVADSEVGMTPHLMLVGKDEQPFREMIADDGRTFALWVQPGVFCFGQPTAGTPAKPLGKPACVEIAEAGKGYYIGSVKWTVKRGAGGVVAELAVEDKREDVTSSTLLVGIPFEASLVSQDVKPEAAAKYKAK